MTKIIIAEGYCYEQCDYECGYWKFLDKKLKTKDKGHIAPEEIESLFGIHKIYDNILKIPKEYLGKKVKLILEVEDENQL